MRTTERLLDQVNRAFGGEAWHGPALRNLLDGITEDQARSHPLAESHSILELVVHVGTWMDVVARRVGGTAVESTTVQDWSDVTKTSWSRAVEELERAQSRLCDALARLSSEELEKPVPGATRSIYSEIMGLLQHNVYHAGQISLLKKALG